VADCTDALGAAPSRIERPDVLRIPVRRAEYQLAESASPPVQAEPRQLDEEIAKRHHDQSKVGIEFAEHYGSNDRQLDLNSNIIS
jgi:hypothetical protein